MSASDKWKAEGSLARRLGGGVRQFGTGLRLEQYDRSIALIATARERAARLRSALAARLEVALPTDRTVTANAHMAIVSCGPGEYLAVSTTDYVRTFAEDLQLRLAPLATVTDYSDHLTHLALSGPGTLDVMARLCSIDLQAADAAGSFAAVTRVGMLRSYVWRAAPAEPLMLAVQRTCAVSFLDALLHAAEAAIAQADQNSRDKPSAAT